MTMKKSGYYRIRIEGHTDKQGGVDNLKLSKNRAIAVSNYLKKIIPRLTTSIVGYADLVPAGSNKTTEGRALNRRVIVTVLG